MGVAQHLTVMRACLVMHACVRPRFTLSLVLEEIACQGETDGSTILSVYPIVYRLPYPRLLLHVMQECILRTILIGNYMFRPASEFGL